MALPDVGLPDGGSPKKIVFSGLGAGLDSTRMWVILEGRPHEGHHRCMLDGQPWRGGDTTWCTSYSRHLSGGVITAGRANKDELSPTRGNLNTPWARSSSSREGGGGFGLSVSMQMWMERSIRVLM